MLLSTACTAGYRYSNYATTVPSDDGDVRIDATEQKSQLGATIDFRYFRALIYGELGSFEGVLTDRDGLTDTFSERRSEYWVGLDAPLLALWSFDGKGFGYPPLRNRRHAIELWASLAATPSTWETNGQLALVYYFERYIGAKIGAGLSRVQFSGNTFAIDGASRRFSDLMANGATISISIVMPAGPWGESILEELLFRDKQYRDQFGGY
jgi:hypothetical protein